MTSAVAYMGRATLAVCAAAAVLGQAGIASALSLDVKDIAASRLERKRAASDGKLPLPGTPDLSRLDQRLAEQGIAPDAPIFIRVFKAESELEIWTGDPDGSYRRFATYPICYWSGTLGPKQREGDRQAPEGFYTVGMEQSFHKGARWPLSLDIGFPNPFDQVNLRSGSAILIHGGCASIGCFAMTNAVSLEVHKLATNALEAGQPNIPVHVFPFRMTEENLARHETPQWQDFWRNLKDGYDLFERTRRPPRVSVCGTHYGFNAASLLESINPGPILVCPETAQVITDLANINTRVAEQPPPQPQPAEIKTASLATTASYLGGPAAAVILNKLGENFQQQVAPDTQRAGVSSTLTRPLPCSVVLPSCRRYASLREQLVHKAALRLEEPEREKAHAPTKKKTQKNSRRRRYSEYDEPRAYSREAYREVRPQRAEREWREVRSSRYD